MLRLFLQQTNQPGRINVILLGKFDHAAFLITFQLPDPQFLRLLAQTGNIQQGTRRIRQQAEAIDKLDFDLFQFVFRFGAGNTFVERQTRVHVRDEIIWQ
ncbi:hypothetical protein ExPUPEC61_01073 [Escherichia coli]|nr:hypothetical protein HmCmsJML188_03475 [Escherichia coli]GDX03487.1 hypothetical protein ExPUPEC61_01073 [Escherichia coli]